MARSPAEGFGDEALFLENEAGEGLDLHYYLTVLARRKRLLAGIFLLVLAFSLVLYLVSPKLYRAVTVLQIERKTPTLVAAGVSMDVDSWIDAQSFYPTQYRLLRSRGLAERVVRKLNLAHDPTFNPPRAGRTPEGATAADDEQVVAGFASKLLGNLEVSPIRDTRLVEIAYVAESPDLAARVANAFAEAYIEWGLEKRSATVGRASGFLASQIEALKREIQDKEAQLQAYSRRTDIVALDPNSNVTLQRLEGLNRDYVQAVSERIQKEAKYKELLNSPDEAAADLVSGGLVGQLRAEQMKLEREYATRLNTFKPDWPAMQELQAKIEKGRQHLENVVKETVANAREQAKAEFQAALRREQGLAEELARQKAEAMKLNSAAVEYNNLKVEVSTRRGLLDELLRKQAETEVSARMGEARESNVLVVDRALPPKDHFRPSLVRNAGFGLVLGLMLGLGAVFLVEYADRRVKTPDEVERVLPYPILAAVPALDGREGKLGYGAYSYASPSRKQGAKPRETRDGGSQVSIELAPVHHPKLAAAEAYRTLRTMLLLSAPGGVRSVVVSSAVTGEGKTTTAANLAVVLAQMGRRVVLVDADLRRSRLHQIFSVSDKLGFVNYLTGEVELARTFVPTSVPNLTLIPAGPHPPNPAELLSSAQAGDAFAALQQEFDYVVVDTPPLLPVTDASVVAAYSSGLVLCVGLGRILREELRSCRDRIRFSGVKVLGVVANRFQAFPGRYGSHYASYYEAYTGFQEGEGQGKNRRAARAR